MRPPLRSPQASRTDRGRSDQRRLTRRARALLDRLGPREDDPLLVLESGDFELVSAALDRGLRHVAACGEGEIVPHVARRHPEAIASGRLEVRDGDLAALPWPDGSFAYVAALDGRGLGAGGRSDMQEIRRVLREGGRFGCLAGVKLFSFWRVN